MRALYSPDRLPVRIIASGTAIMVGLWLLASVFRPFGPPHPALFDHPPPPPPPPPPFVPLHEPVRPPPSPEEAKTWADRADLVRNAFVHAYNGYRRQAFGHDEVRPVSGKTVDGFNAWAVSAVDGLDTMWLMGLEDMFEEAIDLVSQQTWGMGEVGGRGFCVFVARSRAMCIRALVICAYCDFALVWRAYCAFALGWRVYCVLPSPPRFVSLFAPP
ncbi:seven-hairpin glycosidase [Schizophyllum commune H4-8]|uniref:seven-hairpin glycosidase n=1 Tax=Schizophyllum commune (strain H4-8 / FGSC 9210) TaxID=578458 RepID=UPI0021605E5D|nr:seven-hairpin glycosidase [Schizophyllum commune H4-8]KAI5885028.1 seven-hairpin glycosidase [Schizophyllum commune H4-8]